MKFQLLFGVFSAVISFSAGEERAEPKIWALLVAGSNGWYNYRHQADVCHAYQVLHNHGIPDENIVVMMYDDLAENPENPTKGIVINHPMGHDVYKGVPKDYVGRDVTPENFLKILQGEESAMSGIGSGKVIKSGPNDHVFVNFVDHGATGLVAFPNGELTSKELNAALRNMYKEKKYAQLVFYMEACESGSMFRNKLPKNINIYATTAANFNESSYACYYDKKRQTFLGDWYSVNWMEDSDKENLHQESLIKQFQITKKETNTSHVQEYGDLKIGREPVADFQGEKTAPPITYHKPPYSAAPCYEVPLDVLLRRRSDTNSIRERDRLSRQIQEMQQKRQFLENIVSALVRRVSNGPEMEFQLLRKRPKAITDDDCHTTLVHAFSQHCFNFGRNPYALKYAYVLANMCEQGLPTTDILPLMQDICGRFEAIEGGVH